MDSLYATRTHALRSDVRRTRLRAAIQSMRRVQENHTPRGCLHVCRQPDKARVSHVQTDKCSPCGYTSTQMYINTIEAEDERKEIHINSSEIQFRNGGDWICAQSRKDGWKVKMKTEEHRLITYFKGTIVGMWWLDSLNRAEVRRELIKAQKDGHNVVVDA
jgi:hypothetical protein